MPIVLLCTITNQIIFLLPILFQINSQNFSKYNILAVEPLDDRIIKVDTVSN